MNDVILSELQVNREELQAAVGIIVVAATDQVRLANTPEPEERSVHDAEARALIFLSDRIPAGEEVQTFVGELRRHFGARLASQLARSADRIEPAPDKLTRAQASKQLAWVDCGQQAGVKSHKLVFYETAADLESRRGEMTYARVSKGLHSATHWHACDRGGEPLSGSGVDARGFELLAEAKRAAVALALSALEHDGYVDAAKPEIPPSVQQRVGFYMSQLHEQHLSLAGVERARGRGHILSLHLADCIEQIRGPLARLTEVLELAKRNGVETDFLALIAEKGGVPDFERFGLQPAEIAAWMPRARPEKPARQEEGVLVDASQFHSMRGHVAEGTRVKFGGTGEVLVVRSAMVGWRLESDDRSVSLGPFDGALALTAAIVQRDQSPVCVRSTESPSMEM